MHDSTCWPHPSSRVSRSWRGIAFLAVLLACAATATVAVAVPNEATSLVWCAGSKTCLQWSPASAASRYAVYRGVRAQLPMLLTTGVDGCDRRTHTAATSATTLTEVPAPGALYWYLVVGEDTCGLGSAGSATAGPRVVNPSGFCESWCSNAVLDGDETDMDCGGSCGPCVNGKSCSVSDDCLSRRCIGNQCLPALCSDGIGNGGETGVDCGGPCAPCPNTQGCCTGTDCQSATCSGDICGASPCANGALNPPETDIDCGGGTCPACAPGRHCLVGSDCTSLVCSPATHICQTPTCTDGIKNGAETDVDCGGGACPTCSIAKHCAAGGDCQSFNCADGVCCNSSCTGTCQACTAAKKGSGSDGSCGVIGNGQDPDNECPGAAVCNGAGACVGPIGTTCTVGSNCQSGFCRDGVCCDTGCTGLCQACSAVKKGTGTDGTCGNILNGGDPDNECAGTAVCNGNGTCVSPNGAACSINANCQSGFCVDGFCCDTTCNGSCQACSAQKKGSGANGVCGFVVSGQDPDNECQSAAVCNGAGACIFPDGTTCSVGSTCTSGNCVDGVCCNTACTGTCQGCNVGRTGSANGFCTNITAGVDPDNECPGDAFCTAGACVAPNGTTCSVGANCSSGNCVDGVCCNSACTGTCQACSAAKKGGGTDGSCGQVSPDTDPDNECPGTAVCSSAGVCRNQNGTLCATASECLSGNCVDGVCCNTLCSATCLACTAVKKGSGTDGTCGDVAAGTDPDNECVGTRNCNGGGGCTP